MSSNSQTWVDELPEPDPFSPEEFGAWRGLLRLRETVTRELDWRLRESSGLSLDDYGILITLVTQPDLRLGMSQLGARRLLTPSGITRAVMRLEQRGLIAREQDTTDGRAHFAVLTRTGLEVLRSAQRIHHAAVRELYTNHLNRHELRQLAQLLDKATDEVDTARE